jgi:hypothetical protein
MIISSWSRYKGFGGLGDDSTTPMPPEFYPNTVYASEANEHNQTILATYERDYALYQQNLAEWENKGGEYGQYGPRPQAPTSPTYDSPQTYAAPVVTVASPGGSVNTIASVIPTYTTQQVALPASASNPGATVVPVYTPTPSDVTNQATQQTVNNNAGWDSFFTNPVSTLEGSSFNVGGYAVPNWLLVGGVVGVGIYFLAKKGKG